MSNMMGGPPVGFTFNFNGVKPLEGGNEPVPPGVYDFVITDTPVAERGQYQVMTVWLQVESNDEFSGRMVFDDWFMPNAGVQDPDAFQKSLGRIKAKIDAVYGSDIDGDFTVSPFDLIGKRIKAEVYVKQDVVKENGQVVMDPGPNGTQVPRKYPPKNVVRRYIRKDAAQTQMAGGAQPFIPQPLAAPQPAMQPMMAPAMQPQMTPQTSMTPMQAAQGFSAPQQSAPQGYPSPAPAPGPQQAPQAPQVAPQAVPPQAMQPLQAPTQPEPTPAPQPEPVQQQQQVAPPAAQANGEQPAGEPTFQL